MNAKPNAQNNKPHRQVSAMHDSMTFDTSRVRAKPASRNMNPACMKNTKNAVTSVQVVFTGLTMSSGFNAGVVCPSIAAPALVLKYHVIAYIPKITRPRPTIFPPRYAPKARWRSRSLTRTRKVVIMFADDTGDLFPLRAEIVTVRRRDHCGTEA